jgi:hypothetical protein
MHNPIGLTNTFKINLSMSKSPSLHVSPPDAKPVL